MNKVLGRVVILLIFLFAGVGSSTAQAENFNILPYYSIGGGGDWWQYHYTNVSVTPTNPDFAIDFTVTKTLLVSGNYSFGPWVKLNRTDTYIVNADATNIYFYDTGGNLVEVANGLVELDTFIERGPFSSSNIGMEVYFHRLSSIDVLAGTFSDVLLYTVLDMAYPENSVNNLLNTLIGMPVGRAWGGVTGMSAMARHVGEVLNINIDAETGEMTARYELADYSIVPVPGTVLLLGAGLMVLLIGGRQKM